MTAPKSSLSAVLLDQATDWLARAAMAGETLETIVRGYCERITAAGLPLARAHLSFSMLHPLYDGVGFTWHRGKGVDIEGFRHKYGEKPERFLTSPYYYLLKNNLDHVRRRLRSDEPAEFPILADLQQAGMTDYIAFVQAFGSEREQGMMGSWTTDAKHGFDDDMIAALLKLQTRLAIAAKIAVLGKLAENMLTTYLGGNAGKRILQGQIKRGDGETIRAALIMGDMRQSTALAEKEGRQAYINTLNQFFDAIATPFNANGSQIVGFVGDGFLAAIPCERHRDSSIAACKSALSAVFKAQENLRAFNNQRRELGKLPIRYGIGLHIGNVMFGNVGLRDRLTFSAFGSAVNEVERLQSITKKYSSDVIASQSFATYCGGQWQELGEEKLRGVGQKVMIMRPKAAEFFELPTIPENAHEHGMLEAEQILSLHHSANIRDAELLLEKSIQ